MPVYVYILIILALAATYGYFRGRKKNQWMCGWISRELEDVLKPRDKDYVNIGGTIGYNFTYKLRPPLTEAKGTYTLLPRQSILYFPISKLIARHDRFYMNIFVSWKLAGEGHIISEYYFKHMRTPIAGMNKMKRETAEIGGRRFILLWDKGSVSTPLKKLLESLPNPEILLHFCCYRDNNTFFLHLVPKSQASFGALLRAFYERMEGFTQKGVKANGNERDGEGDAPGDDQEDRQGS